MGWVANGTPRPLYPRERLGTHCIGGWVGPQGRYGWLRKILPSPGFDRRTVQPVASRNTDWDIRDPSQKCILNSTEAVIWGFSRVTVEEAGLLGRCVLWLGCWWRFLQFVNSFFLNTSWEVTVCGEHCIVTVICGSVYIPLQSATFVTRCNMCSCCSDPCIEFSKCIQFVCHTPTKKKVQKHKIRRMSCKAFGLPHPVNRVGRCSFKEPRTVWAEWTGAQSSWRILVLLLLLRCRRA